MVAPNATATASSGAASTSAMAVTMPAGIIAGDVILVFLSWTSSATVTPPAGYDVVVPAAYLGTSDAAAVYSRTADGTESGTTVTFTLSGSTAWCVNVSVWAGYRYRVDAASPVTSTGTGTTQTTPALTPSQQSGVALALVSGRGAADGTQPSVTALPTGWVAESSVSTARTGSNRNNLGHVARAVTGAALVPAAAFTVSQSIGGVRAVVWLMDHTSMTWQEARDALVARGATVLAPVDGQSDFALSDTTDYVIDLPTTGPVYMPKGLEITGGRNVLVLGGTVDVRDGVTDIRRAAKLQAQKQTIRVEGVRFGSSTAGTLTEGINLDQRFGASAQLKSLRIDEAEGTYETNHADIIQTWAGPDVLTVDDFYGETGYQGMFMLPIQQWSGGVLPSLWTMRDVSLYGLDTSGYMLWRSDAFPWTLESFVIRPGRHDLTDRDSYLWDSADTTAFDAVQVVEFAVDLPARATTAGPGYTTAAASPSGVPTLAAARAGLAEALSGVGGLAVRARPFTAAPKIGDGWIVLTGLEVAGYRTHHATLTALVFLGSDERTAEAKLDELATQIVDAVTRAYPCSARLETQTLAMADGAVYAATVILTMEVQ